ncbi:MAG: lipoprotein, partial [Clostridia bacterium]|nr:lipoprotein [Clostridia bacterium]
MKRTIVFLLVLALVLTGCQGWFGKRPGGEPGESSVAAGLIQPDSTSVPLSSHTNESEAATSVPLLSKPVSSQTATSVPPSSKPVSSQTATSV